MIENTYRKVRLYDLPTLWIANGGSGPLTVDVSKYQFMKAFAVRIGSDTDPELGPACPVISATYYAINNSEVTLTQQISTSASTAPNSAKSIFGNATSSGFSPLLIPNNATWGHTLCKGDAAATSWLWFPYRLIKLTYNAPTNGNPADSGLLLLF